MMKQVLLNEGKLLDSNGNLCESGYALDLVKEYDNKQIKANRLRIKEWDYYYIGNNDFGVALTIADNSYMALYSVSFLNFKTGYNKTSSVMKFMTKLKTNLPKTSKIGDVKFESKNLTISFQNDGETRTLKCQMKKFDKDKDFECLITLKNTNKDSIVMMTPFSKPQHFYYNQKINCLIAQGFVKLGSESYSLDNSYGVLDWGRGVWTYKNTWYWSSFSTKIKGELVGFNLGYGFGANENATENIIFYQGKGYKVDEVIFEIPKDKKGNDDFMNTWNIKSNDGKVDLKFVPILDRYSKTSAIVIASIQHQVFGKFSGKLTIDDKVIILKDQVGFAEKVFNKW